MPNANVNTQAQTNANTLIMENGLVWQEKWEGQEYYLRNSEGKLMAILLRTSSRTPEGHFNYKVNFYDRGKWIATETYYSNDLLEIATITMHEVYMATQL